MKTTMEEFSNWIIDQEAIRIKYIVEERLDAIKIIASRSEDFEKIKSLTSVYMKLENEYNEFLNYLDDLRHLIPLGSNIFFVVKNGGKYLQQWIDHGDRVIELCNKEI